MGFNTITCLSCLTASGSANKFVCSKPANNPISAKCSSDRFEMVGLSHPKPLRGFNGVGVELTSAAR